ncbi:hypothetical protein ACIQWA_29780 [Kitasatospora sp. NPDC098652]|uniref:hypothetical protein n=1 Tax=Kitasatospora sp. NPDC098652 TaxID=3364095 RepID=UPI003809F4AF
MTKRVRTDGRGGRKAVRVALLTTVAGAAVLGTVGYRGAVTVAAEVPRVWSGEPYPVADPAAVATHLDARTQAVYDALALPPGVALTPAPVGDDGITARVQGVCHARGLEHLLESMNDGGADQPRTAVLGAHFTLAGVSPTRWTEALGRARTTLTAQGWTVVSVDESAPVPSLSLAPPSDGPGSLAEGASLRYDPVARTLTVGAGAECSRFTDGTAVDQAGEPTALPTPTAPKQLRAR